MPAGEYAYWIQGKPAAQNYRGSVRRRLGCRRPGPRRRIIGHAGLPDLELELDAEATAVFPRALERVHLHLLARLDRRPRRRPRRPRSTLDEARPGSSRQPFLSRVELRDGARPVVRGPHRSFADGDADRPVTDLDPAHDLIRARIDLGDRVAAVVRDPDPAPGRNARPPGSNPSRILFTTWSVRGSTLQRLPSLSSSTQTAPRPVTTANGVNPAGETAVTTVTSTVHVNEPLIADRPDRVFADRDPERSRIRERSKIASVEGSIRIRVPFVFATKTARSRRRSNRGPPSSLCRRRLVRLRVDAEHGLIVHASDPHPAGTYCDRIRACGRRRSWRPACSSSGRSAGASRPWG